MDVGQYPQIVAPYPEEEVEDEQQVFETDGHTCLLAFTVFTHGHKSTEL